MMSLLTWCGFTHWKGKLHQHWLRPMFPLSCARVCTCTKAIRRVHTRKLGAHINIPSKNVFAHISYTSFQIQTSPGEMLHKLNFMHTDFEKLEGTLAQTIPFPSEHVFADIWHLWRSVALSFSVCPITDILKLLLEMRFIPSDNLLYLLILVFICAGVTFLTAICLRGT